MGEQQMVDMADGAKLCVETFGTTSDPAILLIAGAASPMDWWDTEFCERLAAGGRRVVRYDFRDTGQSTTYEPGRPSYSFDDLVTDAVSLIDKLDLSPAHVVAISMGGEIAQQMAVHHPGKIATLTLFATSPAGPGNDENGLPPMTDRVIRHFQESPETDWSDRAAAIDAFVDGERALSGSAQFDEERVRRTAGRIFDRTIDLRSTITNHFAIEASESVRPRLGEITAPTLVLHGTEDELFPLGHGEALANEIPGARLLPLDTVGHEMPPARVWDVVIPTLIAHTEP